MFRDLPIFRTLPILLWFALLSLGQQGCRPTNPPVSGREQPATHKLVSVFLNLPARTINEPFILSDIAFGNGRTWHPLESADNSITVHRPGEGGQFFLGRTDLAASSLHLVRYRLRSTGAGPGRAEVLPLPASLVDDLNHAPSLFLIPARNSLTGSSTGTSFRLTAARQDFSFTRDLLFAACPQINTIYVLRTDTQQVIGSMGVTGKPIRIQLDKAGDRLYVLCQDKPAVKTFALESGRLLDTVSLPLIHRPIDFVFSQLQDQFYVIGDDSLLVSIDAASGMVDHSTRLGQGLRHIRLNPTGDLLAVLATGNNSIFVLSSARLHLLQTLPLTGKPGDMVFTAQAILFSMADSPVLYRLDLATNQQLQQWTAASSAHLAHDGTYLYAATAHGYRITVLADSRLLPLRDIVLPHSPGPMAVDHQHRLLYVTAPIKGAIMVVDLATLGMRTTIELDTIASDLLSY